MLTIFSVPKPFVGHINIIQRNAIKSWTLLTPRPEILLIGDEHGTAEIAEEFGAIHIPEVGRNSHGTPLISSIFELAHKNSSTDLMCYVNCDIVFLDNFVEHVEKIDFPAFLMVGQRTNLDVSGPLDFDDSKWRQSLHNQALPFGQRGGFAAIDYFVFTRGLYNSIPEFAVGRIGWDNWLLWKTKSMGVPIIDATNAITAIHQNHSYEHFTGGEVEFRHGSEAKANIELAGGWKHYHNIEDADWEISYSSLRKQRKTLWRMLRLAERFLVNKTNDSIFKQILRPLLHPESAFRRMVSRVRKIACY